MMLKEHSLGHLPKHQSSPKRVFLRKGKKKTKDQHAVKLLKPQKLMKQLLEIIIVRIEQMMLMIACV